MGKFRTKTLKNTEVSQNKKFQKKRKTVVLWKLQASLVKFLLEIVHPK